MSSICLTCIKAYSWSIVEGEVTIIVKCDCPDEVIERKVQQMAEGMKRLAEFKFPQRTAD